MNYIERVLPSLGEDAVTLRVDRRGRRRRRRARRRRADDAAVAAIKGSLRMVAVLAGWCTSRRQAVPLELRMTIAGRRARAAAPTTLDRIRADVLAHHKLNPGRERRRDRPCSTPCGASAADELDLERDEFDDRVTDTRRVRDVPQRLVAAGRARTDALARLGSPDPDRAADRRHPERRRRRAAECVLPRSAEQPRLDRRRRARCSTSSSTCSGRCPSPRSARSSLFLEDDAEVTELVTTMERLAPQREVDPFATAARHLRPHPGRRGPGHHADAVADAAAPRRRARAGPSSATRRRARGPTRARPNGRSPS